MTIAREEIFGPVLSVLKFHDIDEVIDRGNASEYGLAAAVWTRDIGKAHAIANHVRAGTVWINCYDVFDAAAPFGGFKHSGFGRELGEASLDAYTELKTVVTSLDVDGGYAEYVLEPAKYVGHVPAGTDLVTMAPTIGAGVTTLKNPGDPKISAEISEIFDRMRRGRIDGRLVLEDAGGPEGGARKPKVGMCANTVSARSRRPLN